MGGGVGRLPSKRMGVLVVPLKGSKSGYLLFRASSLKKSTDGASMIHVPFRIWSWENTTGDMGCLQFTQKIQKFQKPLYLYLQFVNNYAIQYFTAMWFNNKPVCCCCCCCCWMQIESLILSPQTEIFSGKQDFLKGRPKFPNRISKWKIWVPFASFN